MTSDGDEVVVISRTELARLLGEALRGDLQFATWQKAAESFVAGLPSSTPCGWAYDEPSVFYPGKTVRTFSVDPPPNAGGFPVYARTAPKSEKGTGD